MMHDHRGHQVANPLQVIKFNHNQVSVPWCTEQSNCFFKLLITKKRLNLTHGINPRNKHKHYRSCRYQ